MSHQELRDYDNRTDEERETSIRNFYREKARKQLGDEKRLVNYELPIGTIKRESLFWENERVINQRASELRERDLLKKLKDKYY